MNLRSQLYNRGRGRYIRLLGGFMAGWGYHVYLPPDLVESYIEKDIAMPIYKAITLFGLILSSILTITSLYGQKWILSIGYMCGLIFCGLVYKTLTNKEDLAKKEIEKKLAELVPYQPSTEELVHEEWQFQQ